ncbi:MAG TPA: dienelactone hydrolase family protein [Thiobacillaceae bacterium]|nr:dienelactone hydrolase family protein [Thiobacillaceae bacterium]
MRKILFAALLLAALPALASVVGKQVVYKANGLSMKGYVAYDNAIKGKRPGVLVVHEWWGLNDYARKRANMLAQKGYIALAVDMYGNGKTADHPKDAGALATAVGKDPAAALARFKAAMTTLEHQPLTDDGEIAAIGYCFGGGQVLNMARAGLPLKGVVSFHGTLGTDRPAKPGQIKAKVRVFTGAADPFVPPEAVAAFEKEMQDAQVDYKLVSYPGAMHAFTNPDADKNGKQFNLPLKYDAAADQDSWTQTLAFFKEIFK